MGGTGIGGAGHLREGESGEDVGEGGGLVHGGVFNILKAFCKHLLCFPGISSWIFSTPAQAFHFSTLLLLSLCHNLLQHLAHAGFHSPPCHHDGGGASLGLWRGLSK